MDNAAPSSPFISYWRARGRLPVRHNGTFCYLLRLNLRRYKQKFVEVGVLLRGWVTLNANFRCKVSSPTNGCSCQTNRGLPFCVISKYIWFCHKAHVRQTDIQNYDFQDRADIAASRCKNHQQVSLFQQLLDVVRFPAVVFAGEAKRNVVIGTSYSSLPWTCFSLAPLSAVISVFWTMVKTIIAKVGTGCQLVLFSLLPLTRTSACRWPIMFVNHYCWSTQCNCKLCSDIDFDSTCPWSGERTCL